MQDPNQVPDLDNTTQNQPPAKDQNQGFTDGISGFFSNIAGNIIKKIYLKDGTDIDENGKLIDNRRAEEIEKIKARKRHVEELLRQAKEGNEGIQHDISAKYTNIYNPVTGFVNFIIDVPQIIVSAGITGVKKLFKMEFKNPDEFNITSENFWASKISNIIYFFTMYVGSAIFPSASTLLTEGVRFGFDYKQAAERNTKFSRVLNNVDQESEEELEKDKENTKAFCEKTKEMMIPIGDGKMSFNDNAIRQAFINKIEPNNLDRMLMAHQQIKDLDVLYDLDEKTLKLKTSILEQEIKDAIKNDKKSGVDLINAEKDKTRNEFNKKYYNEDAFIISYQIKEMMESIKPEDILHEVRMALQNTENLNYNVQKKMESFADGLSKIKNKEEYQEFLETYASVQLSSKSSISVLNGIFQLTHKNIHNLYCQSIADNVINTNIESSKQEIVLFLNDPNSNLCFNIAPKIDNAGNSQLGCYTNKNGKKRICANNFQTLMHEAVHFNNDLTNAKLTKAQHKDRVKYATRKPLIDAPLDEDGELIPQDGANTTEAKEYMNDRNQLLDSIYKIKDDIFKAASINFTNSTHNAIRRLKQKPEYNGTDMFDTFNIMSFNEVKEESFFEKLKFAGGLSKSDFKSLQEFHNTDFAKKMLKITNKTLFLANDLKKIEKDIQKKEAENPKIKKLDEQVNKLEKELNQKLKDIELEKKNLQNELDKIPQNAQAIADLEEQVLNLENEHFELEKQMNDSKLNIEKNYGEIITLRKTKDETIAKIDKHSKYIKKFTSDDKNKEEIEMYELKSFFDTVKDVMFKKDIKLWNKFSNSFDITSNYHNLANKFDSLTLLLSQTNIINKELSSRLEKTLGIKKFDLTKNKKIMSFMNVFKNLSADKDFTASNELQKHLFSTVEMEYGSKANQNEESLPRILEVLEKLMQRTDKLGDKARAFDETRCKYNENFLKGLEKGLDLVGNNQVVNNDSKDINKGDQSYQTLSGRLSPKVMQSSGDIDNPHFDLTNMNNNNKEFAPSDVNRDLFFSQQKGSQKVGFAQGDNGIEDDIELEENLEHDENEVSQEGRVGRFH